MKPTNPHTYYQALPVFVVFLFCLSVAMPASAATTADLEVAGWIPYWSDSKGTKDAQKYLDVLTDIHPFAYAVKKDGTLNDLIGFEKSHWKKLLTVARQKDTLITPTVMSSDGALIHTLLSDPAKRATHVKAIAALVAEEEYDGINIDYEGKRAETKDYFSLFLSELKSALGDKRLSCTVEARTPPDSLYKTIPANLQYANDYAAMARACDRIEIMGYDQQRADITLNAARTGAPYMPVADVDWVRKVVELALQSIPKEKLVLGIPTYGHEYSVTVSPNWYQGYSRVGAINPDTALSLAKKKKAKTSRNSAGELTFTYATGATAPKLKSYRIPGDTPKGLTVAAQALAYANKTGKSTIFNVVSWSDATAIQAKVTLAQELGLSGVTLFKIDGQEDPQLWKLFTRK